MLLIPQAPFYGSRVVEDIPLDDVFAFVNETALFKGQWQFKQGRRPAEEYETLVRETVRPIYEELKERSKREQLLQPRVVYGYFPCQSSGNDLIIYQRRSRKLSGCDSLSRASLPGKNLCLADFFASSRIGAHRRGSVSPRDHGQSRERVFAGAVQVGQLRRVSLFPRIERRKRGSAGGAVAQADSRGTGHCRRRCRRREEVVPAAVPGFAF